MSGFDGAESDTSSRKAESVHACAVGFDFDHTLGLDNKLEVAAFIELAQRLARASQLPFDVERSTIAITREIGNYRSGYCTLDQAVSLAFDDALGEGTGQIQVVDDFRVLAVELAPHYVRGIPGCSQLLASLDDARVPYAILTNGWNPLQQSKAECIGFRRPVFVSDDIGVRKPNVHAFNVLRDYFALPADRIWYVGDDPKVDVLGSLGAGMRAIWCDFEGRLFPTDIPAPTAIIRELTDVVRVIDA